MGKSSPELQSLLRIGLLCGQGLGLGLDLEGDVFEPGLYLSNFIRGVEVLPIEVDDRANA